MGCYTFWRSNSFFCFSYARTILLEICEMFISTVGLIKNDCFWTACLEQKWRACSKLNKKKSSICVNVKVQLVTKFYNCHSSRIINSRLQIGRNLLKFLKIFKTEFFENPYNKDKSVGLQEIQCGTVIAFNIISTSENISTQFVCTILQWAASTATCC